MVLGWDNRDLTERCVNSLRSHTDVAHELIIVDNGSTDGSDEFATAAADVAILNDSNLGFAAGMNTGLRVARGAYTAFINNDTVFPHGWASPVIETFESHQRAGIVLPAVTAAGNPVGVRERTGSERVVLTPFGEFPSGVVYVMPTGLIEALGGWNEEYQVASAEDLDLAFTVWAHGLDVVLDERVLVEHVSQASVRKLADRKALYHQNLQQFLDRWESIPLGDEPLIETVDAEHLLMNQERARTAIMWIRRMLAARQEAADLAAQLDAVSPAKPRRGLFRPRS